jgi:hypothetical protein
LQSKTFILNVIFIFGFGVLVAVMASSEGAEMVFGKYVGYVIGFIVANLNTYHYGQLREK